MIRRFVIIVVSVGTCLIGVTADNVPSTESKVAFTVDEDRMYWERLLQDDNLSLRTPPPVSSAPTVSPLSGATCSSILWSDEFEATSLNETIWSYDLGMGEGGFGNLELQTYTDDSANIRLQDGNLVITALEETNEGGRQFTSARIRTEDTVEVLYGNIEARIKLPDLEKGLWPAFWTLGGNFREVGWPQSGEVDIMEMGSAEAIADGVVNSRVSSAAHWENEGTRVFFSTPFDNPTDVANDGEFHTFRLEWSSERIVSFVDENMIWEFDITPEECTDCTEFHQPHFLILNMAVGGIFTGLLDASDIDATFPAEMVVDYVRICDNGETVLTGSVEEEFIDYTFDCGAPDSCTNAALNNYAGELKCGDRIAPLIEQEGLSEEAACRQIAGTEFPAQCGRCVAQVIDCGVPDICTNAVLATDADGFSCRDRIAFVVAIFGLTETDACNRVAGREFPFQCGACNPIDCDQPEICTDAVLDTDAGGFSCRDRITFLIQSQGQSESAACEQIAVLEFPNECGECAPVLEG